MQDDVVVVVAGGEPPRPECALAVPLGARVVAADGGLDHARALGLEVALAVGDLDSVSPAALAAAGKDGVPVERHPAAKDATDLELALEAALRFSPARVLVLAGAGGRLDHLLSLVHVLAAERFGHVQLDAWIGAAQVHVVRGERALGGTPGELVSLLAVHGPAEGVTTEGLAYPLTRARLDPGSSRGVSNVFTHERARVAVERGVLLAVRPGREEG